MFVTIEDISNWMRTKYKILNTNKKTNNWIIISWKIKTKIYKLHENKMTIMKEKTNANKEISKIQTKLSSEILSTS